MLCQHDPSWGISLSLSAVYTMVSSNSSSGLDGGAIAGIVIGSVVGFIFLVAFAVRYGNCKKNQTMSLPNESPRDNERKETDGKNDDVDYLPHAPIHPLSKEAAVQNISADNEGSVFNSTAQGLLNNRGYDSSAPMNHTVLPEIH